jgi:hypothetical protein
MFADEDNRLDSINSSASDPPVLSAKFSVEGVWR